MNEFESVRYKQHTIGWNVKRQGYLVYYTLNDRYDYFFSSVLEAKQFIDNLKVFGKEEEIQKVSVDTIEKFFDKIGYEGHKAGVEHTRDLKDKVGFYASQFTNSLTMKCSTIELSPLL